MIHLVQCLCERRHRILACAWDDLDPALTADAMIWELRSHMAHALALGVLNPWCGLCRSPLWHYEDGITKFRTMAEAYPALKATEEAQSRVRQTFQKLITRALASSADRERLARLWRTAAYGATPKDLLWLTQQTVRLVAERDKLAGIAIEPLRHRALEKPKPRIEKRMKKPRKKSQPQPGPLPIL